MSSFIRWPSTSNSSATVPTYADQASLPGSATDGAVAIALDTDSVYVYNSGSSTWKKVATPTSAMTAGNTNSINLTITSQNITGAVNISSNAADSGFTVVGNSIQSTGVVGLRSQIQNSAIYALFSATSPISYDNTTGVFTLGTVSIAKGGTGQITAAAAFNALSPMTTLGDIIYGGASGVGTRLAGNTTTTKKFLTQTGDSVNSAAPTYSTIVAGDVPSLAASIITSGQLATARGGTGIDSSGSTGIAHISSGTWAAAAVGLATSDVSGILPKANGGTAQDNSSLTFPSSGTIPAITPTNHGVMISSATAAANVTTTGTSGQALLSNGASADPTFQSLATNMQTLVNLGLSVTASAGTLTIALKQSNGSSDPSTGQSAVSAGFRSSTATSGLYNQRSVAAALSQTITSGTTLGMFNTQNNNLWLYLIDSDGAGTMKLGASTVKYDEGTLQSTVPESAAVTITNASPGVFTSSGNNYVNTDAVVLTTSGTLPTGLTAGTKYFVVNAGTDGVGKFRLAATPGGTAINTSSAGSGTHTLRCAGYRLVSDLGYTSMPIRLIGRAVFNLVTAGTWIAATEVSIANLAMAATPEYVGMRYSSGTGQTMTANGNTVVGFGTKNRDSHGTTNNVDTTAFYWVAPAAGQYEISSQLTTASTAWVTGDSFQIKIVKSGDSANSILGGYVPVMANFTDQLSAQIITTMTLSAGDYIYIFGSPAHGSNVATTSAVRSNFIDIHRIDP